MFNIYPVSLQEQYQREQEKLKKEWEKAQLEVEEEERKHNEEVHMDRLKIKHAVSWFCGSSIVIFVFVSVLPPGETYSGRDCNTPQS